MRQQLIAMNCGEILIVSPRRGALDVHLVVEVTEMLVFRAGSHKMPVRIANRVDLDQAASIFRSSLIWVLRCLSMPFWQASKCRNFRTILP